MERNNQASSISTDLTFSLVIIDLIQFLCFLLASKDSCLFPVKHGAHGQARGPQEPYPPTPTCPPHKPLAGGGFGGSSAGERNPPKHGRSIAARVPIQSYAFLHGQGRACTPKCVTARRRGFPRRRMKSLPAYSHSTVTNAN
jgi:hypothetical protein